MVVVVHSFHTPHECHARAATFSVIEAVASRIAVVVMGDVDNDDSFLESMGQEEEDPMACGSSPCCAAGATTSESATPMARAKRRAVRELRDATSASEEWNVELVLVVDCC